MSSQFSDQELVVAAQSGDKQAFGELLDRHQPMVMRIALRMIPQPEVAKELAQEALLEAYLCMRNLRQSDRFHSWLYGIALNVCRTYLRRQHMDFFSLEAVQGGLAYDALPFTSAEPDPHFVAETRELHGLVLAAVNELSPKNRETVLLYYYEALSVTETAGLLGISVAAVKGRLHKARRQLYYALVKRDIRSVVGADQSKDSERGNRMTQDTMVPVEVIDVLRQDSSDHYIIMLAEKEGRRLLPIWIGAFEGELIAMHLLGKAAPRPMTFEFIANLLAATGVQVVDVSVSALRETTFFATLTLRNGEQVQEVDARPSDAIALALRMGCPLYVADEVMAASNLVVPAQFQGAPSGKGLTAVATLLEERMQEHQQAMQELKERMSTRTEEEARTDREKLLVALYGSGE